MAGLEDDAALAFWVAEEKQKHAAVQGGGQPRKHSEFGTEGERKRVNKCVRISVQV